MNQILNYCNQQLKALPCCHEDPVKSSNCDCYECLHDGFYATADDYECLKKLNYYVLNYGPSYSSEVYHYLSTSQILENNFLDKKIKVASLGCGFAPDLIALNKYIADKNLTVDMEYFGIDQSQHWAPIRQNYTNAKFIKGDLLKGFNISGYDIVFMLKVFSTLRNSNLSDTFLNILKPEINKHLNTGSFFIFNDINSCYKGRDEFHDGVKGLFSDYRQFYCDTPPYIGPGWIKIPYNNIVYPLPNNLEINPLAEISKTVFFEYKK
jgi:hypothetical protein